MNKCSFCPYSFLKDGILKCRYITCQLTRDELREMMKLLGRRKEY